MREGPPGTGGRAWRSRLTALAVTLLGLAPSSAGAAACPGADDRALEATIDDMSDAVACLVNQERRDAGLRRLTSAPRLVAAGWRHARDMAEHDYFSHRSRDGRSFVDRIRDAGYLRGRERQGWALGETLVWARDATSAPRRLVAALMNSAPHRRVILDDAYSELGVGIVRGTPTSDPGGVTVTIDYGDVGPPG